MSPHTLDSVIVAEYPMPCRSCPDPAAPALTLPLLPLTLPLTCCTDSRHSARSR